MEDVNTRQWFPFSCFWSLTKSFKINSRKIRPHLTNWKLGPLVLTNPKRFELQLHNSDPTYICCEDFIHKEQRGSKHLCNARPNLPWNKCLRVKALLNWFPLNSAVSYRVLYGKWLLMRRSPGANELIYAVSCLVSFSYIYLTWQVMSLRRGFLAPDKFENHSNEGKGKKKKEERDGRKE